MFANRLDIYLEELYLYRKGIRSSKNPHFAAGLIDLPHSLIKVFYLVEITKALLDMSVQ